MADVRHVSDENMAVGVMPSGGKQFGRAGGLQQRGGGLPSAGKTVLGASTNRRALGDISNTAKKPRASGQPQEKQSAASGSKSVALTLELSSLLKETNAGSEASLLTQVAAARAVGAAELNEEEEPDTFSRRGPSAEEEAQSQAREIQMGVESVLACRSALPVDCYNQPKKQARPEFIALIRGNDSEAGLLDVEELADAPLLNRGPSELGDLDFSLDAADGLGEKLEDQEGEWGVHDGDPVLTFC